LQEKCVEEAITSGARWKNRPLGEVEPADVS